MCRRATSDDGVLRQMSPGSVVYIDGWDEHGDSGDQALVEQKPSGLWVLPKEAPFRYSRSGGFTVRVKLDRQRGTFVVEDLGNVTPGKDHDDCLAGDEVYAVMAVPPAQLAQREPEDPEADTSNDDCRRSPAQ